MAFLSGCGEEAPESPLVDTSNIAFLPAGSFLMGAPEGEGAPDEHPQHEVYLDAYYIDRGQQATVGFLNRLGATKRPATRDPQTRDVTAGSFPSTLGSECVHLLP